VAGTVSRTLYGVAKQVNLVMVKVIAATRYGTNTVVLAGIEYVIAQTRANPSIPMVVNILLGKKKDLLINKKVRMLMAEGIVMVVAAGNEHKQACCTSPALVGRGIISIAATNSWDC